MWCVFLLLPVNFDNVIRECLWQVLAFLRLSCHCLLLCSSPVFKSSGKPWTKNLLSMICTDLTEVCGGFEIDRNVWCTLLVVSLCGMTYSDDVWLSKFLFSSQSCCSEVFETWQAEGSLNDGGIPKVTKALEVNFWTLKSEWATNMVHFTGSILMISSENLSLADLE